MRIAQVSATFLPHVGGVEWKVHYLSEEYCKRGHDVTVFTLRQSGGSQELPLKTHPLYRLVYVGAQYPGAGRLGLNNLLIHRRILSEHRRRPFDMLHCHQLGYAAMWGARVRRRTGVPVVVTTSGDDVYLVPEQKYGIRYERRFDRMVRANVRSVDVIGSVSRGIRAELEAIGTTARIVDIPNGVPWDQFQTGPSSMLRDRLGLSRDTVIVLSVGRNFGMKRYDLGIEAFARVVAGDASGTTVDAHYVIIGRELDSLRPAVNRLGIEKSVTFIKQMLMSDLPAAYHSADIFFNPSELEGFAQVNAQALACGLSCVITDAPGNVDAGDYGGAVIARCNDVASMAACLGDLINSPEKRRALGAAAFAAGKNYAWSRIADKYLGLFHELSANRKATSQSTRG